MEQHPEGNHELPPTDIFSTLNPYFLLLFGASTIISSVFMQQVFIVMGHTRIGISVAPIIGIVLPMIIVTRRFTQGFAQQFQLRPVRLKLLLYTAVASLAMVVVVDYIYVYSQFLMPPPDNYIEGLKQLRPDDLTSGIVTFVGLCVVVPFAEELVFRGLIQRVFSFNMGPAIAITLAGVFFAVIHLNPQLMVSLVAFGIFVGFIYYITGNLWYAIVGHVVLNTVAFTQLAMSSDDLLDQSPFYVQNPVMLALAVLVVVVALLRIKKEAPDETSGAAEVDHF